MLKSNTFNRIIALVAALIIWAYVITVENPPQTKEINDIPVSLTNMDILAGRNLAVSSEVTFTISVSVSGKRADMGKITAADFNATADMRGWQKGEQAVPVEVTGPGNISIVEKRPSKINVNFEDYISVSKPIRIEYTSPFAVGMEPGFIKMVPNQIEVSGAKSQIDEVSYIRVLIDSKSLDNTLKTFNIDVQPIDMNGEQVYAPLRLTQSEVEVTLMLCQTKEVQLYVPVTGQVDTKFDVTDIKVPETVTIRGSSELLDNILSLAAETVDISSVDVTSHIPLTVSLPEGVELAAASEDIGVEINIKGIANKEFVYASNEIQIEGGREGYGAHINDSSIKVKVYGEDSVIMELAKEDIVPFVDLSTLESGVDTVYLPVELRHEKNLRKAETVPEKVFVNIYEYYALSY
jgi:YbbR domain-containing protein